MVGGSNPSAATKYLITCLIVLRVLFFLMLTIIRRELQTLSAAIDPSWNWRSLRPPVNPIFSTENVLPLIARDFMRCAGEVAGGTFIIYGGALNDLANDREPKDFDGHCLTRHHPLLAMNRIERWARQQGYEITHYRRRVRLLWKRLKIQTDHGEYDISFLQGRIPLDRLVQQMADEADVSPCARSAAFQAAYHSERCSLGEARQQLIFRPFIRDRDRFRHFDRWLKYAIKKYPDRAVIYQSPEAQELFAPLEAMRECIAQCYAELQTRGETPTDFEPFRPMVQDLYDSLYARARSQLTN